MEWMEKKKSSLFCIRLHFISQRTREHKLKSLAEQKVAAILITKRIYVTKELNKRLFIDFIQVQLEMI
jgi:hypothetical protein